MLITTITILVITTIGYILILSRKKSKVEKIIEKMLAHNVLLLDSKELPFETASKYAQEIRGEEYKSGLEGVAVSLTFNNKPYRVNFMKNHEINGTTIHLNSESSWF